jgi:dipeptidyl aminopeptidase/acylaminoacyl peptidase
MSVYLLGSDAGEATPIGEIPGSVEDIAWSPEGDSLLVLAADLGSDRAGAQTATKISEQGAPPADPRVVRPQQFWRRLYRVDVASGETSEVGPPGVNVWEFDWRGGAAVAVVSDDPSESAWYRASLALLDLDARSAETIHTTDWQLSVPRLSPDGGRVAFVEGFCSDRGILAGPASVLELGSGAARELAPDLDVSWLQWRDDSTLWYAGWRGAGSICGTLSLDGSADELWSGDASLGHRYQPRISASGDGGLLVAAKEAPGEPPEAYLLHVDRAAEGWQPVSELNAELAAFDVAPWESYTWSAADGLEIEGLLVRPEGGDTGLPLVVLVHGGPTASWSYAFTNFCHPQLLVEAGYMVLMPNPRGSAGRGQEFARMNLGDLGGADLQDILSGVESLVAEGAVDGERVGVTGGSYGGFMSAWAITQTDAFAASVPVACSSNWLSFHNTTNIGRFDELFLDADPYEPDGAYFERSPIVHARKVKTPTLIIHGELDLCTPVGQALELYQALADAGVDVELVLYPREGHGLQEWDHQIDGWRRIVEWFDRHLAGA